MIDVTALFTVNTATAILTRGLAVAKAMGLPVDSWRVGDPTRVLYQYMAEVLAAHDGQVAEYIKAGFLSTATGEWLTVLAREVYGVEREEATYATPSVTLTNTGGGYYPRDAGDVTVKNSLTGKTYRSTSAGILGPGNTVTFTLIADEAGSDSSVAANDLDEIVTTMLGVEIASSTASVAQDEQTDESLRQACRDSLGALSPNGPPDAYDYVVRRSALTGVTEITRSKTYGDEETGDVSVYVASASGAVSGGSVTAAQNAVNTWAKPLCIKPVVASATAVTIDVTATVSGDDLPADFETRVNEALLDHIAELGIGAPVYRSALIAVIHSVVGLGASVNLTTPAADVVLADTEVPASGTFDVTEV